MSAGAAHAETLDGLFVTLSVGPHVDEHLAESVRSICEARPGPTTVVIRCENRVSPDYDELMAALRHEFGVVVLDSVPDRICSARRLSRSEQAVEVDVEEYVRWTIEAPASDETRDVLQAWLYTSDVSGDIELVDSLGPYKARKAFLVNGPHTALALKTAVQTPPARYPRPDQLLSAVPAAAQMLEALHFSAIRLLLDEYPNYFTEEELSAYAEEVLERFRTHPDSADRILNKLATEDYVEFVIGYHERLLEPAARGVDPALVREISDDVLLFIHQNGMSGRFFTEIGRMLRLLRAGAPD